MTSRGSVRRVPDASKVIFNEGGLEQIVCVK
jgi:hypothetical protein